jgi:3-dehydroquinate synthase
MTDAAIGGKTAINYLGAKNQIGTFYPAEKIIIIPEFTRTLSEAEYRNGLAEMLKLKLILQQLPEIPPNLAGLTDTKIILDYACAKMQICSSDLSDRNARMLLNLGHTFGHILESITAYKTSHGEAVGWGIAVAVRLSVKLGFTDSQYCNQIIELLKNYGFHTDLEPELQEEYLRAFPKNVLSDKKNSNQAITLVLFNKDHTVITHNLNLNSILPLIRSCI